MTGLLDAAELASMRADALAMLPGTCALQTATWTVDAGGGGTLVYATTATAVPCKLAITTQTVPDVQGQPHVVTDAVLSVAWNRAIVAGQRVSYNGDTWEVDTVEDDHDWRALRRAHLKRLE